MKPWQSRRGPVYFGLLASSFVVACGTSGEQSSGSGGAGSGVGGAGAGSSTGGSTGDCDGELCRESEVVVWRFVEDGAGVLHALASDGLYQLDGDTWQWFAPAPPKATVAVWYDDTFIGIDDATTSLVRLQDGAWSPIDVPALAPLTESSLQQLSDLFVTGERLWVAHGTPQSNVAGAGLVALEAWEPVALEPVQEPVHDAQTIEAMFGLAPDDFWVSYDGKFDDYVRHWDGAAWATIESQDDATGLFALGADETWFLGDPTFHFSAGVSTRLDQPLTHMVGSHAANLTATGLRPTNLPWLFDVLGDAATPRFELPGHATALHMAGDGTVRIGIAGGGIVRVAP